MGPHWPLGPPLGSNCLGGGGGTSGVPEDGDRFAGTDRDRAEPSGGAELVPGMCRFAGGQKGRRGQRVGHWRDQRGRRARRGARDRVDIRLLRALAPGGQSSCHRVQGQAETATGWPWKTPDRRSCAMKYTLIILGSMPMGLMGFSDCRCNDTGGCTPGPVETNDMGSRSPNMPGDGAIRSHERCCHWAIVWGG